MVPVTALKLAPVVTSVKKMATNVVVASSALIVFSVLTDLEFGSCDSFIAA